MKDFLRKLGSRKFIVALISIISGILTIANCDDSLIQLICGVITVVVPVVLYIITEGALDYKGIGLALDDLMEIIQAYIDARMKENETKKEEMDEAILKDGELEINEDGIAVVE